jgi:hypothetical protein
MARRPDPAEPDRPLTQAELQEYQRRLSALSPMHVADAYRRAHNACKMQKGIGATGESGSGVWGVRGGYPYGCDEVIHLT